MVDRIYAQLEGRGRILMPPTLGPKGVRICLLRTPLYRLRRPHQLQQLGEVHRQLPVWAGYRRFETCQRIAAWAYRSASARLR